MKIDKKHLFTNSSKCCYFNFPIMVSTKIYYKNNIGRSCKKNYMSVNSLIFILDKG